MTPAATAALHDAPPAHERAPGDAAEPSAQARPTLHLLHIGKTGGTALRDALSEELRLGQVRMFGHKAGLADVPPGEPVGFVVRDPVDRFVSGFNSRLRRGRPRMDNPWSESERKAFERFPTPNDLAEALSSDDADELAAARQAIDDIDHTGMHLAPFFGSIEEMVARARDIVWVATLPTLAEDFERLKQWLGVTAPQLPQDDIRAHRNPTSQSTHLSARGADNVRRWYGRDYEVYHAALAFRARQVAEHGSGEGARKVSLSGSETQRVFRARDVAVEADGHVLFDPEALGALGRELHDDYVSAAPFPHAVIDGLLPAGAATRLARDFPSVDDPIWLDWRVRDRVHQPLKQGIGDAARLGTGHPFIQGVLAALNSSTMVRFLEALTGIEGLIPDPHLSGGGLHQILSGGRLSVHADFNKHPTLDLYRRLNLLIYLNENWSSTFGGELELWNSDMSACVRRVQPLKNRCVIFNTDRLSFHGHPEPLRTPGGVTRRSIAMYYYTAQGRPDDLAVRPTGWELRPGEVEQETPTTA